MTNAKDNLSRPGIIDARARYRAAAQPLRNTDLRHWSRVSGICCLLSTRNFVHDIPIIHYSCKLADHQVTHVDSEMRRRLSYNRQVITPPALTSAVMYLLTATTLPVSAGTPAQHRGNER